MVDQIRTLLLNRDGVGGYRKVSDAQSDAVMSLFGLTGGDGDGAVVDTLLPLAMADDLVSFRSSFDGRVSPDTVGSIYKTDYSVRSSATPGLYDSVLGTSGWWRVSGLFRHEDPSVSASLIPLRDAAACADAPFALGAVLLTVAYRRSLLQGTEE